MAVKKKDKNQEITLSAYNDFVAEKEHLENVEIPANNKAIAEARAQGDLSENADYAAANERQAEIMGRLKELEYIIKNSTIIKFIEEGVVCAGSRVTFIDDAGKEYTKQFVYPAEVDPLSDKISLEAPVGKAFLGKKENDSVIIPLPSGLTKNYIIIKILNKND